MIRFTLQLLLISLSTFVYGQNMGNGFSRYISVTGSAEMTVQPDEIVLEIVLIEYDKKKKKVDLAYIEKEFFNILKSNHIDKEKLVFGNTDYYWYYWWGFRNYQYKQKIFKLNLDKDTDFMALVKGLNIKGINSIRISNTINKKIQKLRKDVKISAIKAAKEKAVYLLESIDEKVGRIISIEEVPNSQNNYYWRNNRNLISNAVVSNSGSPGGMQNVTAIKLRYEVKAKFEIGR